jgi:hypothetical protein
LAKPTEQELLQEAIEAFEKYHRQRGFIYDYPDAGSYVTKRRVWLLVNGRVVAKYDWKQRKLENL